MTELNSKFTVESGTGADGSCSFVHNGLMYIVGGWWSFRRQVSIVESCRLRLFMTLKFDFRAGACNNFDTSDGEEALLCFGYDDRNGCYT